MFRRSQHGPNTGNCQRLPAPLQSQLINDKVEPAFVSLTEKNGIDNADPISHINDGIMKCHSQENIERSEHFCVQNREIIRKVSATTTIVMCNSKHIEI